MVDSRLGEPCQSIPFATRDKPISWTHFLTSSGRVRARYLGILLDIAEFSLSAGRAAKTREVEPRLKSMAREHMQPREKVLGDSRPKVGKSRAYHFCDATEYTISEHGHGAQVLGIFDLGLVTSSRILEHRYPRPYVVSCGSDLFS
jgi:hypothetical protein